DPWQIENADQLHSVRDDLDAHYILISHIDLGIAPYNEEAGWEPVGIYIEYNHPDNAPFTGSFNGNGYTISGLYLYRPNEDYQGFFAEIQGASLDNITLLDIDITANNFTGGLVGSNIRGIISNASVSGVIVANSGVGGLVGLHSQQGALISDSDASVDIIGVSGLGGLVGTAHSSSYIRQSSANGTITGTGDGFGNIGGLAGTIGLESGISDSHASGDVTSAGARVGGLVGAFTAGRISDFINCYATGKVSGVSFVGGLVGYLSNSKIADSFATGDVEGESFIGGLVGDNDDGEIVYHPTTHWRHETYASGNVTGTGTLGRVGGLVGSNRGSIVRAYATGVVVGTDQ
ncbi:GLUG motif-containing protein, partial [Balneolaceae bacterium ANBcel3]|nr:GLUG motif-containing protein [Balneolaceae bacterium ANBcel3]